MINMIAILLYQLLMYTLFLMYMDFRSKLLRELTFFHVQWPQRVIEPLKLAERLPIAEDLLPLFEMGELLPCPATTKHCE